MDKKLTEKTTKNLKNYFYKITLIYLVNIREKLGLYRSNKITCECYYK